MRRVSLLNSCVLICFRPNNSTFTIHITVLYLFRSHPRHNSCIQFVSLRRVQPTYIFVHSEVNPKYLMPLYSVSTAFNITKFYGATPQLCDNRQSAMHPNTTGWEPTYFACSVSGLPAQTDHRYMWPDAVQWYHPPLSSPSRRGHERGQLVIHWIDIITTKFSSL